MNLKLLFQPRHLVAVLRSRWINKSDMDRAVRAGVQRFKNDPNYRPDLVPSAFAPRHQAERDDSEILRRIIVAYKKAKTDQKCAPETFNVSNEWLPIYESTLGPVMQALNSEDLPELHKMYANFFRDPCSTGLLGYPLGTQFKMFASNPARKDRDLVLVDMLHRLELWKRRTGEKYTVRDLESVAIGNPFGSIVDGTFIRVGADYHHYYAQAINSLLPSSGSGTVIELGGGFGGMAYFLLRNNPRATYIDFDLPEALALASYYLLMAFPDLPVTLYGEAELSPETLEKSRIIMMPSFEIRKMPSKTVDVAFNSYSLAEMSPQAIHEYIAELTRCAKGHFLHINHTQNSVVSADDFCIENNGFALTNRELAGWTVGLNPKSDEFEYLYKAN
jgi:putative sugar O-methyltransferase